MRDGAEVAAPDPLLVRAEFPKEEQAMRIGGNRIVPVRRTHRTHCPGQTVQVDIEIDLIRQCREDWRRGETEVWRRLSIEADLRRDADGHLRLHGLPGHDEGVIVPAANAQGALTRFEQPGLCVTLSSAAIREAEATLGKASVIALTFKSVG